MIYCLLILISIYVSIYSYYIYLSLFEVPHYQLVLSTRIPFVFTWPKSLIKQSLVIMYADVLLRVARKISIIGAGISRKTSFYTGSYTGMTWDCESAKHLCVRRAYTVELLRCNNARNFEWGLIYAPQALDVVRLRYKTPCIIQDRSNSANRIFD